MTTLLLGLSGPPTLLLTLAGERPLLLECPPELRVRPSEPPPPEPPPLRAKPRDDWGHEPPPETPRRVPEVPPIDPRTLLRGRRAPPAPPGPRTRASEPAATRASEKPVADLVIVPASPGFRASEQGVKALVTYLRTAQILVAKAERPHEGGTRVELLPDVFSHLAFVEGAAPPGPPSVLEGTLWFSAKPAPLPYGDPARMSCFRIELVGLRYARPSEAFLARLHQILHLRPEVVATSHEPSRLRTSAPRVAADPIPRVDMQEL
jgi:hypothetical protein